MFTTIALRMALILAVSSVPATAPPKPAAPRPLTVRDVMSPKEEAACGLVHLTAPERAAFEKWLNRYTVRLAPPDSPRRVAPDHLPSSGAIHDGVEPPTVVQRVEPPYPEIARQNHVEGTVLLRVLVDTDGRVTDVEITKGVPELDEAAIAAARQWIFEPGTVNGALAPEWIAIPFEFAPPFAPGVAGHVSPKYPESARKKHIEGRVLLNVLVGADGRVAEIEVVMGVPELNDAAVEAVKQWVFPPAIKQGKPVAVWATVPVDFSLTGNH